MTTVRGHIGITGAAAGLLVGVRVLAQPAPGPGEVDGNSLVQVSVAAEHEAVSTGEPTDLAIRFEITKGWHVYWKNPGDTGAEMLVTYRGPDWASIGELRWPVPQRYRSPGDLLDFVHEGTPTLLTPLSIDEAAWIEAGRPATLDFQLDCEWFVCKEICLLGDGSVNLSIPVTTGSAVALNPASVERFAEARSKLPTPYAEVPRGVVDASFENGVLRIAVPRATRLTFFPEKSDKLALPLDALSEAQKQGRVLSIRYRDEANEVEHLDGVLVIERGTPGEPGYQREAIELRVPVRPETTTPE